MSDQWKTVKECGEVHAQQQLDGCRVSSLSNEMCTDCLPPRSFCDPDSKSSAAALPLPRLPAPMPPAPALSEEEESPPALIAPLPPPPPPPPL